MASARAAVPPATEPLVAGQSTAASHGPPVHSTLEIQVELHRRGFSCGSIDGVWGGQTESALHAFQRRAGIAETGILDEPTQDRLRLTAPATTEFILTATDLGTLHPVPDTWLEKSRLTYLGFGTALEMVGERFHAHPNLLRRLNPEVDWANVLPGLKVKVPAVEVVQVTGVPDRIVINLGTRELEVVDNLSQVVAHFPVSIGRIAEKFPEGELRVTVIIPNPDYNLDPDVFPDSAEAKELGRKLTIPPGPNNPLGVAWIGLDRPGCGIHGTPESENVGRMESDGCFRLANWDVVLLSGLVKVGMNVDVEQ